MLYSSPMNEATILKIEHKFSKWSAMTFPTHYRSVRPYVDVPTCEYDITPPSNAIRLSFHDFIDFLLLLERRHKVVIIAVRSNWICQPSDENLHMIFTLIGTRLSDN